MPVAREMKLARLARSSSVAYCKTSPTVRPEGLAERWRCAPQRGGLRTTSRPDDCNLTGLRFADLPVRSQGENADLEALFARVPLHEALFDFVLRVSALKKKTFVWEHSEKTAIAHEERVVSS